MKKVLIIDDVHAALTDGLMDYGYHVDYLPEITRKEVEAIIEQYAGLIVRSKLGVDEDLLSKARRLKFIARAGAGLDQLDMEAIGRRGIEVVNAPEGNRDALGEHLMGMLLSLLHNIDKANTQVRSKIWDREGSRGKELGSMTVGLIGYGMMGSSFADKLRSFGCEILAYDKYKSGFSNARVKEVELNDLYQRTDILSLHVPLTDETEQWIDGAFVDRFSKPIYLLNSARGKVVVLKDLIKKMGEGKVLGACLDVLENEKMGTYTAAEERTFEELCKLENVLLTPHVAGWTFESYERISTVLLGKIKNLQSLR